MGLKELEEKKKRRKKKRERASKRSSLNLDRSGYTCFNTCRSAAEQEEQNLLTNLRGGRKINERVPMVSPVSKQLPTVQRGNRISKEWIVTGQLPDIWAMIAIEEIGIQSRTSLVRRFPHGFPFAGHARRLRSRPASCHISTHLHLPGDDGSF